MQMRTEKFNEVGLTYDMLPEQVIMYQFGLKLGGKKVNVSDLYMPQLEQDKMADWMKSNLIVFKRMSFAMIDRQLQYVILDIFPNASRESE